MSSQLYSEWGAKLPPFRIKLRTRILVDTVNVDEFLR
jgi:hypothetical protein